MIRVAMSIIFPLITFPYASRILLSEGIGSASYVASITSYFQLIAALGINTYAVTEGAKIRDDKQKLSHFATEMFSINLITTIISYLLFFVLISSNLFENYRELLLISSISIIFSTIGMEWLYSIIEEYQYITVRSVLTQFLSLILLFLLVKESTDIPQYVALTAISAAGSGIFNLVHSRKYIRLFADSLRSYHFIRHLKPIFIIFGTSVAATIYMNSDITMLGIMKDDKAVGEYTAAVKMNRIICALISSLSAVLLPRISYVIEMKDQDQFNDIVKKAIHFMLIIIIPAMLGVYLLSDELITIFAGNNFRDAIPTMKIMTFNLFLSPINGFLAYQILIPFRKEKISFVATVAGAIFNLVANFLLIPKYSHAGAAVTTVMAEFIVMIILVFYVRNIVNIPKLLKGSWQYLAASVLILPVYFIIIKVGVSHLLLKTGLIAMFGAASYFAGLIAMKNSFCIELLSPVVNKLKHKKSNS